MHWENDPGDEPPQGLGSAPVGPAVPSYLAALPEPQLFNCDVRNFDWSILGKFGVIMTDPPWHIRQVSVGVKFCSAAGTCGLFLFDAAHCCLCQSPWQV